MTRFSVSSPTDAELDAYDCLVRGLGYVPLEGRTQLELTGQDRAGFLHNLCTNHIRRLQPGQGCEAFITNVQGKDLGHVQVFASEESLVLETVAGQGPVLLAHFERYTIREKVEIHDRTSEWHEFLVASSEAQARLAQLIGASLPENACDHFAGRLGDSTLGIRRTNMVAGTGILVSYRAADTEAIQQTLEGAEFHKLCDAVWDVIRIEAGWPEFGVDISAENLPQEVNRTDLAISFTKGCYLGQETVARIDALGHVNWNLMGLRFDSSSLPEDARAIVLEGKTVARIGSRCWSPRLKSPLALAYIRSEFAAAGQKLVSPWGTAIVVAFPLS